MGTCVHCRTDFRGDGFCSEPCKRAAARKVEAIVAPPARQKRLGSKWRRKWQNGYDQHLEDPLWATKRRREVRLMRENGLGSAQIARKLKISQARVCQLYKQALESDIC